MATAPDRPAPDRPTPDRPTPDRPGEAIPDIAAKVAFLRRPDSYPRPPATVEVMETHMSWIFLAGRFAYKLKKPVRLPFLDFSTLERRRHFCQEEIRLNRRLAPRVYRGLTPLTREAGGGLALGGSGPAVDWLVTMFRLPAGRLLDHAIGAGTFKTEDIDRLGHCLAKFFRGQPAVAMTAARYRRRFAADVRANGALLSGAGDFLALGAVAHVHAAQRRLLGEAPALFDRRIAERRIIEGHGDLRPEHVLLGRHPQVIDCLEFNRAFRILDPADELCFFAMECAVLGAPEIGARVFDRYREATGDVPPPALLHFYTCYRACLRTKIAVWHLRDPGLREPVRWRRLAGVYLAQAVAAADAMLAAEW